MSSSSDLDEYELALLESWEQVYRRGLLTMWLLLAVSKGPRYAAEITKFVNTHTHGTMKCDERSLYRAMRRLSELEMVEDDKRPGERTGAARKYYMLTETGRKVLDTFLRRNIRGVYGDGVDSLFELGG
jgi:PadR family transcriptional regulator PadR